MAININGNLDAVNGNLDAGNVNLGPVNGNLDAMKKLQIAVKISILLFIDKSSKLLFFFFLNCNEKNTGYCCFCHIKKPSKLPIFTANCFIFIAP